MYVQYRSNALVNCYVQIGALHVQCDVRAAVMEWLSPDCSFAYM